MPEIDLKGPTKVFKLKTKISQFVSQKFDHTLDCKFNSLQHLFLKICHIFTVDGLELQRKKIFLTILRQIWIKIMIICPTFFLIIMFHRRKVILHLNSLLAKKCPLFSKSMFQFFYFAKIQKRTGTLNKTDPIPDVIKR